MKMLKSMIHLSIKPEPKDHQTFIPNPTRETSPAEPTNGKSPHLDPIDRRPAICPKLGTPQGEGGLAAWASQRPKLSSSGVVWQ